jgi:glycosyltransferase involved in cell wall biosynthesis
MTRIRHIAILIPARDEEQLLPRCLTSVLRAASALPPEITCDIIVAVDSSTDRTLDIAESMLGIHGAVIVTNAGSVGAARSLAATEALSHYTGTTAECWLANTDADCEVPHNWLLDQLHLAQSGTHAVAGTVDIDDFSEHHAIVEQRFRETYLIHADGTHPHVHGANIGMRADVYLRAGGWSSLRTAEDHDLWNRLSHLGFRKHAVARLKVFTSGRRTGRAPHGFATALAAHNEAAA